MARSAMTTLVGVAPPPADGLRRSAAAAYPEGMSAIQALGAHMRDRFEEKGAQHGLAYPWWIAIIGGGGGILCVAVAAVGQRGLFTPPELAAVR